jgi:YidC/Oxa1 family membrane protein insertase
VTGRLLAQSAPPAALEQFQIEKSVDKKSIVFENENVKARLGVSGLESWLMKKYTEDLYSSEAMSSENKTVRWTDTGFVFNSLLPESKSSSSLTPSGTVRWIETDKCYLVTFDSSSAGYLPEGLLVTMRWQFSEKFSGRLTISVKNITNEPIALSDKDGSPLLLYGYPLFKNDTYRSVVTVVKPEEKSAEVVSPEKDVFAEVKTGKSYIGATNQYYAFALKETTDSGLYFYTKRSIKIRDDSDKEKEIPTPVVGWKFLWSKIRGNESLEATFEFYLGPKQENLLQEAGYIELFDTWNGWTGPIGKIMFALLTLLYSLTGHYGYAIILLTLVVKIMLHPFSRKQMISMRKMQAIQPQMNKIKAEIKDSQKQQLAMQKLFVDNEVSPLGGCLPLLFQLPIFIALYTCLSSAIELKNVSFLWLPDLSMPDPTYALPVLFAVGNYFSMQANSQGSEQMPAMKYMPVMMFFFFMNLASGVLIYFVGQSVFSFVEQKYNMRHLDDTLVVEATKVEVVDSVKESVAEGSKSNACKKKKKK